ncbi:MAG: DNA adenine methylase [Candidatus Omnitrophica bacterium]|nr:DNA adenine methylase [Candidatus Omnitrophota bacterium]
MVLYPAVTLTAKLTKIDKDHEKNRNKLRKIVIDSFISEKAGSGKGDDTSKYKYIVETLNSGDRIYLTRPVSLNKGFDFIIHVENNSFKKGKDNPRHADISEDLTYKKHADAQAYNELVRALEDVFYCKDPDDVYPAYKSKLSPEAIRRLISSRSITVNL